MIKIDFKHNYYKLGNKNFTTIRGVAWDKKVKLEEIVEITKNGEYFCHAKVELKVLSTIKRTLPDALKKDCEYPGFELRKGKEHEDFISLLNSFYPRNRFLRARADMETMTCLIHLTKVNNYQRSYTLRYEQ